MPDKIRLSIQWKSGLKKIDETGFVIFVFDGTLNWD